MLSSIYKVDSSPPGVPAEGASDDAHPSSIDFWTSENGVQCPERGVSLHLSWEHLV